MPRGRKKTNIKDVLDANEVLNNVIREKEHNIKYLKGILRTKYVEEAFEAQDHITRAISDLSEWNIKLKEAMKIFHVSENTE